MLASYQAGVSAYRTTLLRSSCEQIMTVVTYETVGQSSSAVLLDLLIVCIYWADSTLPSHGSDLYVRMLPMSEYENPALQGIDIRNHPRRRVSCHQCRCAIVAMQVAPKALSPGGPVVVQTLSVRVCHERNERRESERA